MEKEYDLQSYRLGNFLPSEPSFPQSLAFLFTKPLTYRRWFAIYTDIYTCTTLQRDSSLYEILLFIVFTLRDFYDKFRREAMVFGQFGIAKYLDYQAYFRVTETCKALHSYNVSRALCFVRYLLEAGWSSLDTYYYPERINWATKELFLSKLCKELEIRNAKELVQILSKAAFTGVFPKQAWPDLPLYWPWISHVGVSKRKKPARERNSKKQKLDC